MKLAQLYKINSLKGFLISALVHGVLIALLATATVKLAVPEGDVFDTEVDYSGPGALGTPVEVVEKPSPMPAPKTELPAKAKKAEATATPEPKPQTTLPKMKAPPVKATEEGSDDDVPVESEKKQGWVPVEDTDIQDGADAGEGKAEATEASSDDSENDQQEEDAATGGGPTAEMAGTPSGDVHSDRELVARQGNPKPSYPMFSRLKREQGTVVLRFTVDDSGSVDKVWVHQSSGFKSLDEEAVKAQQGWKYQPGKSGIFQKQTTFSLKGQPVEMPYQNK
jgi:TonB family protein